MLSIAAYEARERMLDERARILEVEAQRLEGAHAYSVNEIRSMLDELYTRA